MLIDIKKIMFFLAFNYILIGVIGIFHFFLPQLQLFAFALPIGYAVTKLTVSQATIGLFVLGVYVDAIRAIPFGLITTILLFFYVILFSNKLKYGDFSAEIIKILTTLNFIMHLLYLVIVGVYLKQYANTIMNNVHNILLSQLLTFILLRKIAIK